MHIENLRRVIAAIKAEPDGFDQNAFPEFLTPPCESPCCVFGWAKYLAITEGLLEDGPTYDTGREFLDLDGDEAELLFASAWPVSWFVMTFGESYQSLFFDGSTHKVPDHEEAIAILTVIADNGRAWSF